MGNNIKLNFEYYPLVVGQLDKYTFSDWEKEGGNIQLEAFVENTSYTKEDVSWNSSNELVATVDNGKVHALTTGICEISAVLPNKDCAKCIIQVIDNPGRLTALHVTLNTTKLVLNKTEGASLYPLIIPVDYFKDGRLDSTFSWTSSNEDVAIINSKGRVYAKETGTAIITGTSNDIGRSVSCEITVIEKNKDMKSNAPLEDMDGGKYRVSLGDKLSLQLPEKVKDEPVVWCSDNVSKAVVDEHGNVSTYSEGFINVWATFINGGYRIKYELVIFKPKKEKADCVVINKKIINVAVGEQTTITGTVFPATLLDKSLMWKSADENVLKIVKQRINLSGIDEITVEGVADGETVLTCAYDDCAAISNVIVDKKIKFIDMLVLPSEKVIEAQETAVIDPVINKNAMYTDMCWISENREVVTVDKDGVIKGYNSGEANVYCVAIDSLDDNDLYELAICADERNLSSDRDKLEQMKNILEKAVYDYCKITVKKDNPYIYNIKAPKETVTEKSACLLWNSDDKSECNNFKFYNIYVDDKLIDSTDKISFTVKGLNPETEYEFKVTAVDENNKELASRNLKVTTKESPKCLIDVSKEPYNAVGNGIIIDTLAIQRAINDCPPNGVVLLPEGKVFLSGALFLKSDMTLQIDGILFGSDDPVDYPYVVCRWEGYRNLKLTRYNEITTKAVFEENVYSHSSLINVGVYDEGEPGKVGPFTTKNVKICGKGMINGNGFTLAHNQGPCWYIDKKGLPMPQSPKRNQNIRGRVIAFYNTRDSYISDVTVAYGPSWTIHPVFSNNITFDNVKVISMGNGRTGVMEGMLILNGDGIDPDSCTNINIVNCYFTVGDDAVAIKSGRNRQGNELAKPSAYIRVSDCKCVDSKGSFCIGSEQSGGAHDILFQNLYSSDILHFGLWIKSAPSRGGLVEDVIFRDCILKNTGGGLQIEYNHGGNEDPASVLPVTRQIAFENISFYGSHKFGVRIIGIEDSPICNVSFKDCFFAEDFIARKEKKFYLRDCFDVDITGLPLPEKYKWEND